VLCGSNGIAIFTRQDRIWLFVQSFDGMSGEVNAVFYGSSIVVTDPNFDNGRGRLLLYIEDTRYSGKC